MLHAICLYVQSGSDVKMYHTMNHGWDNYTLINKEKLEEDTYLRTQKYYSLLANHLWPIL